MTTVAWDGKTLAADTAVSDGSGGPKTRFARKIRRCRDGRLIGGCGDVDTMIRLMDWVESGKGKPPFKGEAEALVIGTNGEIKIYDERGTEINVDEDVAAIGSGEAMALGALLAGASAEMAVQICIDRDPNSGFDVAFLTL